MLCSPDLAELESDGTPGKVIVGVSGSPGSLVALHRAIAVALGRNARLTIVAAVQPPAAIVTLAGPLALSLVLHQREAAAHERLSAALRHVPQSLPVTTRLRFEPVCTALRGCSDGDHDLVVVGETRRPGTVRGALRRSVGARLSRDPAMRVRS